MRGYRGQDVWEGGWKESPAFHYCSTLCTFSVIFYSVLLLIDCILLLFSSNSTFYPFHCGSVRGPTDFILFQARRVKYCATVMLVTRKGLLNIKL